jgi:hypothetical protein
LQVGRSSVWLLSWIVAAAFILATALLYVDRLNLVATPPDLGNANMVDRALGSVQYKQAIWPVFLWTNLLFGIGFVAAVAFAAAVRSRAGGMGGLPVFGALATTGGIIGAIASIIPIGAVNAAVWLGYCDCGFKETEIISQEWAQMVTLDISDWFNRVAGVILAIALVALIREAGAVIPPLLRTWTYLTAIALAIAPVLATIEKVDPIPAELLTTAAGVVLVPVWALWLGRAVERMPGAASA